MAPAGQPQSWYDLHAELAGLVLSRLPAYSDRVRFGAVCRHWSFCLSSMQSYLPKPLPCLAFPDGTFFSLPNSESCQFPGVESFHSSCSEWLVFVSGSACYLKDPFSKTTLTLPNLSCFCPIDEPAEIINGRVKPDGEMPEGSLNMDAEMSIDKVVVCSALIVAAMVNIGRHTTIALCRPGDDSWLVSKLGSNGIVCDMMLYEGTLYALEGTLDLLMISVGEDNDNGKLSISRIERLIETKSFAIRLMENGISAIDFFLAECNGALLLVFRTIFADGDSELTSTEPAGVDFKVFKADFGSSQWEGVTTVGNDMALFVSRSYCQSLCVSQYNKQKGNCIWFLDDGSRDWFWKDLASSFLGYDMIDGRSTHSCPMDCSRARRHQ